MGPRTCKWCGIKTKGLKYPPMPKPKKDNNNMNNIDKLKESLNDFVGKEVSDDTQLLVRKTISEFLDNLNEKYPITFKIIPGENTNENVIKFTVEIPREILNTI